MATELSRFPRALDQLPELYSRSSGEHLLTLLHRLYEQREQVGFTLLDAEALRRFEAALPDPQYRQTPYIPPRIWLYQLNRLREFLDDFLAHKASVEACFRFCMDAYVQRHGSVTEACLPVNQRRNRSPFVDRKVGESFLQVAERFGIDVLLRRWCNPRQRDHGINAFASYLSLVGRVGTAYVLNFSMMRIEEAWSLRADCLEIEEDPRIGSVFLLKGSPTKTIEDGDARWITSASTKAAIDAMASVANLRIKIASENRAISITAEEVGNPHLNQRAYEPWANTCSEAIGLSVRPHYPAYWSLVDSWPTFFDVSKLTITEHDLLLARSVTMNLDPNRYAIGEVWPLAWHQLRRTGAVNMQASGVVSDQSIQYQLKHESLCMALYYGRGYSRVCLSDEARTIYIRTMYEMLSKEIARLFSDRFVSPYGEKRKTDILKVVDPKDSKKLIDAAKQGKVSWRETLLGGCTKRGACAYGGITNLIRCGGGDGQHPCSDALFDRDKEPHIRRFRNVIVSRLEEEKADTPYRESLEQQKRSVENALNVLAGK